MCDAWACDERELYWLSPCHRCSRFTTIGLRAALIRMVYACIIHPVETGAPALFSQFYSPEGNDESRDARVAHLVSVVSAEFQFRIGSRYSHGFQELETLAGTPAVSTATSSFQDLGVMLSPGGATQTSSILRVLSFRSPKVETDATATTGPEYQSGAEEGIIRIPRGPLFECAKILVWRQILGCVYTLVCEPEENLVTASTWISMFVAVLSKHFSNPRISEKRTIFTDHVGDILAILKEMLPCGKLLFLNGSVLDHLHRKIAERGKS